MSKLTRTVKDYDMIKPGDKIAVAVSGGKDSLVLLLALNALRRFYINKFDICAITVSLGFDGFDTTPIADLCNNIGVPYHVCNTMIGEVVFNIRKEKNPCSLCANMRRGAINDMATSLGCNKIALGHNKDDFVETSIMRLFYEGNFKSFLPVTYLSRQKLYVIRPLVCVLEKEIKEYAKKNNLPIVKNPCPADKASTREDVKQLLNELSKTNRNLKNNIFGAVQRSQ